VVVEPLYLTILDFLPAVCRTDCWTKGLEENKALLEVKIEETKNLMKRIDHPNDLTLMDDD
jgi:hypothetical protein